MWWILGLGRWHLPVLAAGADGSWSHRHSESHAKPLTRASANLGHVPCSALQCYNSGAKRSIWKIWRSGWVRFEEKLPSQTLPTPHVQATLRIFSRQQLASIAMEIVCTAKRSVRIGRCSNVLSCWLVLIIWLLYNGFVRWCFSGCTQGSMAHRQVSPWWFWTIASALWTGKL